MTDINYESYKYNCPSHIKTKHDGPCQQINRFKIRTVLFTCSWNMVDTWQCYQLYASVPTKLTHFFWVENVSSCTEHVDDTSWLACINVGSFGTEVFVSGLVYKLTHMLFCSHGIVRMSLKHRFGVGFDVYSLLSTCIDTQ